MLPAATTLPPVSVVWGPLAVERRRTASASPACSTPSGTMPSLLTGSTPPLTSA